MCVIPRGKHKKLPGNATYYFPCQALASPQRCEAMGTSHVELRPIPLLPRCHFCAASARRPLRRLAIAHVTEAHRSQVEQDVLLIGDPEGFVSSQHVPMIGLPVRSELDNLRPLSEIIPTVICWPELANDKVSEVTNEYHSAAHVRSYQGLRVNRERYLCSQPRKLRCTV